jgi:hypothetical protein
VDYQAIADEIASDPLRRGYAGMTDAEVAESLNAASREVDVQSVTGQTIFEALVKSEYDALPADDKRLVQAIVGMETILLGSQNTRADLLALGKTIVSRARELQLGYVKPGYVQKARAQFGGI